MQSWHGQPLATRPQEPLGMEVPATAAVRPSAYAVSPWRALMALGLLAAAGVSLAISLILLVRGWLGFHQPLTPSELAAAGCLSGGLVLLWHYAFDAAGRSWREAERGARPWMLLVHGLADTSAVSLALALSASSSLTAGLLLLWAPLVVAETLWWPVGPRWAWLARLAERPTSSGESTEPPCDDALDEELVEDALLDAPLLDDELDEDASSGDEFDDELDDDVLQRTTRVRQDGSEWFIGQYRCHFEPGERTQTVHVVFCPPSHSTPELICTRISGPAAQIKPTQVQPYGARLEVRLSRGTHEPVSVVIAVHARLGD